MDRTFWQDSTMGDDIDYSVTEMNWSWDTGEPAEIIKTPWRVRFRLAARVLIKGHI